MEYCGGHYEMPMHEGCRPKCKRRCVHEFTEKFKVYENCSYEVVKICPVCGLEHHHPMCCPRCGHHGHMGMGMGMGHMGMGMGMSHMGMSMGHMGMEHGGFHGMGPNY